GEAPRPTSSAPPSLRWRARARIPPGVARCWVRASRRRTTRSATTWPRPFERRGAKRRSLPTVRGGTSPTSLARCAASSSRVASLEPASICRRRGPMGARSSSAIARSARAGGSRSQRGSDTLAHSIGRMARLVRADTFAYGDVELDPVARTLTCRYRLDDDDFAEVATFDDTVDLTAPGVAAIATLYHLLAGLSYYKAGAARTVELR